MTTHDLQQRVSTWLIEDAEHRVPDHLQAVLTQSATMRQRPAWSSLERWLPMDLTTRTRALVVPASGRTGRVLAIGLVVAALLGIALALVGSRPQLPSPFGLAENGRILSASDGDIYISDSPTDDRTPLITGPENDYGPWYSHDGTRFVFWRELPSREQLLMIANADGSGVRPLIDLPLNAADWFEWSPDDTRLAVVHSSSGRRVLSVVDSASGALSDVDMPGLNVDNNVLWRPPTGSELVFTARPAGGVLGGPSIYGVRPDGTGLRTIVAEPPADGTYRDLEVSPDGSRAAYWIEETVPGSSAPRARIHLVDLVTREDRSMRFDPTASGEGQLRFSPDGRTAVIVLMNARVRLAVVDLDGKGSPRAVGSEYLGTEQLTTMFSPDGRTFVLAFEAPRRPVFVDLASGAETTSKDTWNSYGSWQRRGP